MLPSDTRPSAGRAEPSGQRRRLVASARAGGIDAEHAGEAVHAVLATFAIDSNDIARFRAQYDANLTAPAQAELYRSTPVAYVWDDHDYGPNDADSTSPARVAAHDAYRRYVPHYPLAGQPETPINQAFTIGRVRFLLTDSRSDRTPGSTPEAERSMLGAGQRAWLERELLAARDTTRSSCGRTRTRGSRPGPPARTTGEGSKPKAWARRLHRRLGHHECADGFR